ncbi:MAG: hypothetical protein RI958_695 [Actinomycetota bacterium]
MLPMTITQRTLGPHTTVLVGDHGGRYPDGNSVVVRGADATVLVDPSTSVAAEPPELDVDLIVLTHAHEDHVAGMFRFPHAEVHVHDDDLPGVASLDGLMQIYGLDDDIDRAFRQTIVGEFTYVPRPDAHGFSGGTTFDLGGVRIEVVHLPGHTRGHCALLIEPDGVLITGDIDLSTFGPYYGDAWSDLDAFETSLHRVRSIEAAWYSTFHHKGVVEGHDAFVSAVDTFAAVIGDRERRMIEFAQQPRTLADFVAHRFVYRPGVDVVFADAVERRSAQMSIERLVRAGRLLELDDHRWCAVASS